jgi:putative membrane protein
MSPLPTPPPPPGLWQTWDWHPSVLIGLALLGGLYVYWGGLRASRRQIAAFAGALVVLGLSLNGPLHNLSDRYLFSAHMGQHLVLTLVFPPLLLYGTPAWVIRPIIGPRAVQRLARWATRPLVAGVLFSVPITLWHFPQFYEAALEHHPLHIVQHLVFLATAVIMWWPVLSPVPELPRASYPTQLIYLFALGLPMSLAGALITLSDAVLYPFYIAAPRLWGLTSLADQQLGGLAMWVVGTIYLWVAASVVWFRWAMREEQVGEGEDGRDGGGVERAVPPEAYATRLRPSPPTGAA